MARRGANLPLPGGDDVRGAQGGSPARSADFDGSLTAQAVEQAPLKLFLFEIHLKTRLDHILIFHLKNYWTPCLLAMKMNESLYQDH